MHEPTFSTSPACPAATAVYVSEGAYERGALSINATPRMWRLPVGVTGVDAAPCHVDRSRFHKDRCHALHPFRDLRPDNRPVVFRDHRRSGHQGHARLTCPGPQRYRSVDGARCAALRPARQSGRTGRPPRRRRVRRAAWVGHRSARCFPRRCMQLPGQRREAAASLRVLERQPPSEGPASWRPSNSTAAA